MDSIQLILDVYLKRIIQDPKSLINKQHQLFETTYPLLVSYLTWLRKINSIHNKEDIQHQNEQENSEFKFLCKHNLLFFLTITGQFNVIEKLSKAQSFTAKLCHLLSLIKKEYCKARKRKKKRKILKESQKTEIHKLTSGENNIHGISNMEIFNYYTKELQRIKCESFNQELAESCTKEAEESNKIDSKITRPTQSLSFFVKTRDYFNKITPSPKQTELNIKTISL